MYKHIGYATILSMMQEPESGNHDAQCSSCLFSGDAKGSMLGTLKREQSLDQLRPYQIIRSWSPALITKIFHNLPHKFWLFLANKTKTKKMFSCDDFFFLVSDYLETWLNLMTVSIFFLKSRQGEPQTRWLSVNARLDTFSLDFPFYRVKIIL